MKHSPTLVGNISVLPAVFLSAIVLASCSKTTASLSSLGNSVAGKRTYLGSPVSVWSKNNDEGNVAEIGIDFPLAIAQKSTMGTDGSAQVDPANTVQMTVQDDVKQSTYVDHVQIDYYPSGHAPDMYKAPHFDLTFFAISAADQDKIDCTDTTETGPEHLPGSFVSDKPGLAPDGGCTPKMGIRATDIASPEYDMVNRHPFDKTMAVGFYGGNLIFIQPMITREQLLKKEDFTFSLATPPYLGKAALYPTVFTATYDTAKDMYHFVLSKFVHMTQ